MRRLRLKGTDVEIRFLTSPYEMDQVARLQSIAWGGRDVVVPPSMMVALAHEGGLVLGAYVVETQQLIGFVLGFLGFHETPEGTRMLKHCSHMLAVHPEWRGQGLGYWLKRAQWQWVRHQGIELITWTYDPLWTLNAHLNIRKLGGIVRTYYPNYYGEMTDGLNKGLPTDRFLVELWVNSSRVKDRMSSEPRKALDFAHFVGADVHVLNPTTRTQEGWLIPPDEQRLTYPDPEETPLVLVEIPSDFFALKGQVPELARQWRFHVRHVFMRLFEKGYMVTDFLRLDGPSPRAFYALSYGLFTLGSDS